jgi:hypothetical protein
MSHILLRVRVISCQILGVTHTHLVLDKLDEELSKLHENENDLDRWVCSFALAQIQCIANVLVAHRDTIFAYKGQRKQEGALASFRSVDVHSANANYFLSLQCSSRGAMKYGSISVQYVNNCLLSHVRVQARRQ